MLYSYIIDSWPSHWGVLDRFLNMQVLQVIPAEVSKVYKYFRDSYVLGKPFTVRWKRRPLRTQRRHPSWFPSTLWRIHNLQAHYSREHLSKKKSKSRRKRLATIGRRHDIVPLDKWLLGVEHNTHFSSSCRLGDE